MCSPFPTSHAAHAKLIISQSHSGIRINNYLIPVRNNNYYFHLVDFLLSLETGYTDLSETLSHATNLFFFQRLLGAASPPPQAALSRSFCRRGRPKCRHWHGNKGDAGRMPRQNSNVTPNVEASEKSLTKLRSLPSVGTMPEPPNRVNVRQWRDARIRHRQDLLWRGRR